MTTFSLAWKPASNMPSRRLSFLTMFRILTVGDRVCAAVLGSVYDDGEVQDEVIDDGMKQAVAGWYEMQAYASPSAAASGDPNSTP